MRTHSERALVSAHVLEHEPQAISEVEQTNVGSRNIAWGWGMMFLGAVSGAIMMAWSFAGPFSPPPGFTDYADLSRRLTRLAHIALFMLPLINVVMGLTIDRTALSLKWKERTSWGAIVGMIGIPTGLLLGAIVHIQLKYVAIIPVYSLLGALVIMSYGAVKARSGSAGARPFGNQ